MNYRNQIEIGGTVYEYYDITKRADAKALRRLPYTIRILLEGALRKLDHYKVSEEHLESLTDWHQYQGKDKGREIPFIPSRIILQDFTGVPAIVDLAAMRDETKRAGKNPELINPNVKVDLIIDHSLMVDDCASKDAFISNINMEFKRNKERYRFLKWAMNSFENLTVHPPGEGIIHQINLEQLASVVMETPDCDTSLLYPDTLVGTDSHSTMINGLGILGFGVGGIEAEAAMLGQAIYIPLPEVLGVKLVGSPAPGITSTDISLAITNILRERKVVGKFVEYFGEGAYRMSLTNRATIANMAPEYGATMGYFAVDDESLHYLRSTGRSEELIAKVEAYYKANLLFREEDAPVPQYSDIIEIDLSTIQPAIAGPKRPQDLLYLNQVKENFYQQFPELPAIPRKACEEKQLTGEGVPLSHGDIVLAAITSCTNTSNPHGMMGAGLLAKKAVELGLSVNPKLKTSMTPGSKAVTAYLKNSGLLSYLEELGFYMSGYGCATCIGNSGPLVDGVSEEIKRNDIVASAVLSGNRNFEGRIHADIKANYLASPMLVIAYAIKGTVLCDIQSEPLGRGKNGVEIYLKDIFPSDAEIDEYVRNFVKSELFSTGAKSELKEWMEIQAEQSPTYAWNEDSTYIREAEFFMGIHREKDGPAKREGISGARVLAYLGDSVTTDHISPAGSIKATSPAGLYLKSKGVGETDFNSYGSRRGNHEIMMRGTFANTRIKNKLLDGVEGGFSKVIGEEEVQSIFDVAMAYKEKRIPAIILAGKEYGTGSSRDWAAKGPFLQGVRAVIAESFERIHRSNLIGMGILPLRFQEGESAESLGLTGLERYDFAGLDELASGKTIRVSATDADGKTVHFEVRSGLENKVELDYYENGGILNKVLRDLIKN